MVSIDRNGMRSRKYWTPDFDAAPLYRREEDYIERARELLDLAVASAMRDTPHIAIATSGGLDSSAIAATAARLGTAESITCFSRVPPAGTQIDVGRSAISTNATRSRRWRACIRAWPCASSLPNVTIFDEDDTRYFVRANLPALGPMGMGIGRQFTDAILAAGHRVVLIGNYGDFGLSWRGPLSLVALLHGGQWSNFAHELRAVARESDRSLTRTFAADVIMPTAPFWMRRLIYRLRGRDPDSVAQYSALNPAFIAEIRSRAALARAGLRSLVRSARLERGALARRQAIRSQSVCQRPTGHGW